MKTWQEDQLHALHAIECEHALFEMIVSIARDLGFDHQKAAQEKFIKVQEAYEHIKKERGMV